MTPRKPPLDKPPLGRPKPGAGGVLLGILLVARGRADGLLMFGTSREAVLTAIAPLAAFLLVGGFLALLGGVDAVTNVVALLIVLLSPLVLSFEVARRWGRAAQWPRFAVAFCWCQWAGPMALAVVLVVMSMLMSSGLSGNTAAEIGVTLLFSYALWLHWFLARHALDLSRWRAVGLVLVVNVLTTVLILLPQLADYVVNGPPAG
jgi:hypothetical protein